MIEVRRFALVGIHEGAVVAREDAAIAIHRVGPAHWKLSQGRIIVNPHESTTFRVKQVSKSFQLPHIDDIPLGSESLIHQLILIFVEFAEVCREPSLRMLLTNRVVLPVKGRRRWSTLLFQIQVSGSLVLVDTRQWLGAWVGASRFLYAEPVPSRP